MNKRTYVVPDGTSVEGWTDKAACRGIAPTSPEAAELLAAELALVDAESAWYRCPGPGTAAEYLAAVTEVVDLYGLYGFDTAAGGVVGGVVREVA